MAQNKKPENKPPREPETKSTTAIKPAKKPQTIARRRPQSQGDVDYINKLSKAEITNANCLLSNALVTRYLERIADHAVYVCESVIYIVTGEKLTLS